MPATWEEVASNPKFQALPPDQQIVASKQYFDSVVAPKVPKEHLSAAQQQFSDYAARTMPRSFGESTSARAGEALDEKPSGIASFVRKKMLGFDPLTPISKAFGVAAAPLGAAGETIERKAGQIAGVNPVKMEKVARDTGDVTSQLLAVVPGGRAAKAGEDIRKVLTRAFPEERANTYIAKTIMKGGKSPDEALAAMKAARAKGLTAGESAKNPELLGMQQKISTMNRPGGAAVREFAEDRVNPNATKSFQSKLGERAGYLQERQNRAGKNIGKITQQAGKTPINMAQVTKPLSQEEIFSNTPKSATVKRIQKWVAEAKAKGNTFQAWHEVKQNIANLHKEAANPTTAGKINMATVDKYYKKVNDVLSGRSPGLPESLRKTAGRYAYANETYAQNRAGEAISSILKQMPRNGTPTSKLNYLYKNLAGSEEVQQEILGGMPASERAGMMKLLESISEAGRSGLNDLTKTQQGTLPKIPLSKAGAFGRLKDWMWEAATRNDYDAIGRALTNPDIRYVSEKILKKSTPETARAAKAGSSGQQVPWGLSESETSKVDKFINGEKLKNIEERENYPQIGSGPPRQ